MGLYLRLTEIAFVGRSLTAEGGQNPLEPAMLDTAVLAGRNVQNFREAYQRLIDSGGAKLVRDRDMLAGAVNFLLDQRRRAPRHDRRRCGDRRGDARRARPHAESARPVHPAADRQVAAEERQRDACLMAERGAALLVAGAGLARLCAVAGVRGLCGGRRAGA